MESENESKIMKENSRNEHVTDTQQILQLIWGKRFFIVGVVLLIGALTAWNYISAERELREAELAQENLEVQLSEEFSGVNLTRIERGVYRLRVEVFGDHGDPRREDTYIDFDRDLMVTIYENQENHGNHGNHGDYEPYGSPEHILAFNIENLREDVEIVGFKLRGRLNNRERNYQINLVNVHTDYLSLGYRETSSSIPISIHTTDQYHEIDLNNFDWLRNMGEFRNHFELTFFQATLYLPEFAEEKVTVRYFPSSDIYETRVGDEADEFTDYTTAEDDVADETE